MTVLVRICTHVYGRKFNFRKTAKKITSNTLITTNIEEKRNLVLNLIELTMINQEEKRNLGLKSTVGEVEIEPFK